MGKKDPRFATVCRAEGGIYTCMYYFSVVKSTQSTYRGTLTYPIWVMHNKYLSSARYLVYLV